MQPTHDPSFEFSQHALNRINQRHVPAEAISRAFVAARKLIDMCAEGEAIKIYAKNENITVVFKRAEGKYFVRTAWHGRKEARP